MNELITINLCLEGSEDSLFPVWMQDFLEKRHVVIKTKEDFKISGMDYLLFSKGRLTFISHVSGPMSFDFSSLITYHKTQQYRLSQELLYRALGLKKSTSSLKSIWDITCGTGKDLMLIASYGAHSRIEAFERHPVIYLLLKDALCCLEMSRPDEEALNIFLNYGDSSVLFPHEIDSVCNQSPSPPDVIYYDPMYPDKKKSALPRKEMQIFKNIVGSDDDCKSTLAWALKMAKERVVVKRAPGAPPIKENPTASFTGKSVRYDMYKII